MWLLYLLALLLCIFVLLYKNYITRHAEGRKRNTKRVKLMAVLGSGGHTTEMVELLNRLDEDIYQPRVYVVADTDKMSSNKENFPVESFKKERQNMSFTVVKVPRSREVGQNYITSILTTLYATYFSAQVVWKEKPDLILLNGPGTCIPIAIIAAFLDMLRIANTCIVFEESICRVQRLSLSGLILYYTQLADELIVQWPQLAAKYPRCRYIENL